MTSSWRWAVEPTAPTQIRATPPVSSGTSKPLATFRPVVPFTVEEEETTTGNGLMKAYPLLEGLLSVSSR